VLRAIVLGLIQGLTEFLPISSSGHLALAEKFMGTQHPDMYMQVFLHFGTLLALLAVYYRRIGSLLSSLARATTRRMREGDSANVTYVLCLAVGTVPAMIVGYMFRDLIENAFDRVYIIGILFLVTGTFLFLTRLSSEKRERVGVLDSILVGFAQAFALLPGISRSGLTISTGIFRGIKKSDAADFSFLLAIPSILIVSVYDLFQVSKARPSPLFHYLVGTACALLVGYCAVRWLLVLVRRGRLSYFSFYCWSVGAAALIVWPLRVKGGF